jgi:hypothetical protein
MRDKEVTGQGHSTQYKDNAVLSVQGRNRSNRANVQPQ